MTPTKTRGNSMEKSIVGYDQNLKTFAPASTKPLAGGKKNRLVAPFGDRTNAVSSGNSENLLLL